MLVDHYQNVVPIFVEHAIEIDRMDFLFVDMYEKLKSDSIAKGVFLEVSGPGTGWAEAAEVLVAQHFTSMFTSHCSP